MLLLKVMTGMSPSVQQYVNGQSALGFYSRVHEAYFQMNVKMSVQLCRTMCRKNHSLQHTQHREQHLAR
jgi:hypothetical protein